MKTLISITLGLVGVTTSLLGQGTLLFANNDSSLVHLIDPNINVPVDSGFVQLLWAPLGSSFQPYSYRITLTSWLAENPAWHLLESSLQPIGPRPGLFDAGVLTVATPAPGAVIDVAVAAWNGNFSSFDRAVLSGLPAPVNISGKFSVDTGNPNAQPPEAPGSIVGPGQFQGMILEVPEPGSLALALVAAATLLTRGRNSLVSIRNCGQATRFRASADP